MISSSELYLLASTPCLMIVHPLQFVHLSCAFKFNVVVLVAAYVHMYWLLEEARLLSIYMYVCMYLHVCVHVVAVKCASCERWFRSKGGLAVHKCSKQ